MYGTKSVKRCEVKPGQLIKYKGKTWTASANMDKALYLMSVAAQTRTTDEMVELIITKASDAI